MTITIYMSVLRSFVIDSEESSNDKDDLEGTKRRVECLREQLIALWGLSRSLEVM